MDKERKPGEHQQTEPGPGPEEMMRFGRAVPDADPAHAEDAEGHGIRFSKAVPEADEPEGPGIRQRVDAGDADKPGPDEGKRH